CFAPATPTPSPRASTVPSTVPTSAPRRGSATTWRRRGTRSRRACPSSRTRTRRCCGGAPALRLEPLGRRLGHLGVVGAEDDRAELLLLGQVRAGDDLLRPLVLLGDAGEGVDLLAVRAEVGLALEIERERLDVRRRRQRLPLRL